MNSRTLLVLGVLTVAVAALAFWSMRGRSTPAPAQATGAPGIVRSGAFFPGLAARANDVAVITVKGSGKEAVVRKAGDGWVMSTRGDYPVETTKVRDAVLSLAELQVSEPKTADPAKYPMLGVQEPADAPDPAKDAPAADPAQATPRLVTLKDSADRTIASVIVGSSTSSFSASGSGTSYSVNLRRQGEAQAFQAKGRLDPRTALDPDPMMWLKRDVLQVDAQRVRSATVSHPDGSKVVVSKDKRDDRDYKVADVPAGRELKYAGIGAQVANALSYVNFDDVMPVAQAAEGATPSGTTEYRTFDGLVVTVDTSTRNGTSWVTFAARSEAPPEAAPVPSDQPPPAPARPEAEVKKEAEELNARLAAWAYAIPSTKVKQIVSTMEDLLKPAEQTPVKIEQGAPETLKDPITGEPVTTPEK